MSHEKYLHKLYENFLYICEDSSITIVGTTFSLNFDKKIVVPAFIDDLPVKKIGSCSFANIQAVKEIVLPQTIEVIENLAFVDCWDLEEINFPKTLIKIGEAAFKHTGLKRLVFDGPIKFIGKEAFFGCTEIKSIYFETYRVEKIGAYAFSGCYNIEKVDIDDSDCWCETVFESKHSNPLCESYGRLLVDGESHFRISGNIKPYTLINCKLKRLHLNKGVNLLTNSFNNIIVNKLYINGDIIIKGRKKEELNFFKEVGTFEIRNPELSTVVSVYEQYTLPEITNNIFFSLPCIKTKLS